eukprot:8863364-Pyramimonas_sp.AAC.1
MGKKPARRASSPAPPAQLPSAHPGSSLLAIAACPGKASPLVPTARAGRLCATPSRPFLDSRATL